MDFFFYCDTLDSANTHVVHSDSCCSLPEVSDRSLIGIASSYEEALNVVQKQCPDKLFSPCKDCC